MTTWTDEEIRMAGYCDGRGEPKAGTYGAFRGFLDRLGAVSPRDARERERAAFMRGCQEWGHLAGVDLLPSTQTRDVLYPSLTPPEPPPLVLSGGKWRRKLGEDHNADLDSWWWEKTDEPETIYRTNCCQHPKCKTASDARALADWLSKYGTEAERA